MGLELLRHPPLILLLQMGDWEMELVLLRYLIYWINLERFLPLVLSFINPIVGLTWTQKMQHYLQYQTSKEQFFTKN